MKRQMTATEKQFYAILWGSVLIVLLLASSAIGLAYRVYSSPAGKSLIAGWEYKRFLSGDISKDPNHDSSKRSVPEPHSDIQYPFRA